MRSAAQQAEQAGKTAAATGAGYGGEASAVNAQLLPFLTRTLNNPQGFTQPQTTAMLGSAMGGAGGAAAGLTTEANLRAARERNPGAFSGSLDEMARLKGKTLAGTSEGIAANDAMLKQKQQQEAAAGLGNLQALDTNAQLKAMGLVPEDIDAAARANSTGWLQNMDATIAALGKAASGAAANKASVWKQQ
jgi:hypothetical protein